MVTISLICGYIYILETYEEHMESFCQYEEYSLYLYTIYSST